MSTNLSNWTVVSRESLSEIFLGQAPVTGSPNAPPHSLLGLDAIAVSFSGERDGISPGSATLVLIAESTRVETLSWLRVNCPEIFPLSQFSRVLSTEDWVNFGEESFHGGNHDGRPRADVWASVVAGEMIAQGDLELDLAQVPMSRAAGCFSIAVARASLAYGSGSAAATCVERLKFLEHDQRFSRRHVAVRDLEPVWAVVKRNGRALVHPETAIELVFEIVRRDSRLKSLYDSLARVPGLHSDAFEERVVAFNSLVDSLKGQAVDVLRISACSAVVAIAAFLVGRGTSHEFLVRRNLELFPYGPVWFGLLAGLAGPTYWDATWARFAKGVERQVRSKFRWDEAAGYDLCWAEYSWYASTFDDRTFSQIPKLLPKVLSVEVLPGVACQLRISAAQPSAAKETRTSPAATAPSAVSREATLSILEQLVQLGVAAAENVKAERKRDETSSRQASLFEKSTPAIRSRAKKPKGGG